jgi:alkylation response protein AidB-like acyl-CoA dehydrogenase
MEAESVRVQAAPFEGGYRLSGTKRFVAGAAQADAFIVSARAGDRLALYWVPRDAAGTALVLETLADGRSSATLTLADTLVPRAHLVAQGEAASAALGRALDHARVIASAELCGVMSRALEMTLEYLRTRVQFGKPIGSFQAIQHKCANMMVQVESSKSATYYAAWAVANDVAEAPLAAAMAKAYCSDAYRFVAAAHGSVQPSVRPEVSYGTAYSSFCEGAKPSTLTSHLTESDLHLVGLALSLRIASTRDF